MRKTVQNIVVLGFICLISAVSLSAVFELTDPLIQQRQKEVVRRLAEYVLPGAKFQPCEDMNPDRFVAVNENGQAIGAAYVVSVKGYGGPLRVVVGFTKEGKIQGVRVAEHHETPGLGSGVAAPEFCNQFAGKRIADLVAGAAKLDAVTGATISSKAVESAVRDAINRLTNESFYQSEHEEL